MKFAAPIWLFGTLTALVVAGFLIAGGVLLGRSIRRFGDEPLVLGLVTARAGYRRALKGVLLVLAVAFGFLALAQPQYGRGTRLIPATNLDIVLALDFSKSMYARDIAPSRTLRAKDEVQKLIADLPGARFGAVAFAGQPMAFPLTSDGAAIAQFFRQITPNDMPVGGTAIARALEAGRELLLRDPLSKGHRRVMVLVTDGEDLEGDPVAVAETAKSDEITIYVVQIGGRTPEPIPEVNEFGETVGFRTDDQGQTITTSLSADGEEQLGKVASVTGGNVVRSAQGETGIAEVERRLKLLMTEELSEKVETVYADVYAYPLGLALLLVLAETLVPESRKRKKPTIVPPPIEKKRPRRRKLKQRAAEGAAAISLLALGLGGCDKIDQLFTRNSPVVDTAIHALDAGDAGASASLLEEYLSTGKCEGGNIGTPDPVRDRHNAGFDLGLGLFALAERFGKRFGDEESNPSDAGPSPEEQALLEKRSAEIDCALRIVRLIAGDSSIPIDLRARAHYLAGNLEFLRRDYRSAVKSYDLALQLIPGLPEDAGDGIGRDAAYNRSIALRRIEDDERDAGKPDSGPPDSGPPDSGPPDSGRPDSGEQNQDGGSQDDKGQDAGQDASQPKPEDQKPDAGEPPEPKPEPRAEQSANQDDRILDQLEDTPTFQQQDAKNRALKRSVGVRDDK